MSLTARKIQIRETVQVILQCHLQLCIYLHKIQKKLKVKKMVIRIMKTFARFVIVSRSLNEWYETFQYFTCIVVHSSFLDTFLCQECFGIKHSCIHFQSFTHHNHQHL